MKKSISIIVPVYNEQDNIEVIVTALQEVISKLEYTWDITFIDDGSNDNTLENIRRQSLLYKNIFFISLARNFGHQNALKAGLNFSKSDCVITMDGDMQHPPSLIPKLVKKWEEGFQIVYTIRNDNDNEIPTLKRKTSKLFYNVLNSLSDIKLEPGTADFRLLDKKIVDVLRGFSEDDLFWRGLIKWVGFKQISIEYTPDERKLGKSKYTLVQHPSLSRSTLVLSRLSCLSFTFPMFSIAYILDMLSQDGLR